MYVSYCLLPMLSRSLAYYCLLPIVTIYICAIYIHIYIYISMFWGPGSGPPPKKKTRVPRVSSPHANSCKGIRMHIHRGAHWGLNMHCL